MEPPAEVHLHAIRITTGDAPKASIIDFVMAVTGKNNNHAAEAIRRLKKRNVTNFDGIQMFKFPGMRQKIQYVLSADECVRIGMALPGRKSTQFRSSVASVVTQVFAIDPTLDDLSGNHLSSQQNTIQHFAGSNVEFESPTDDNESENDQDTEYFRPMDSQYVVQIDDPFQDNMYPSVYHVWDE
jgi:hypothetical protein